LSDFLVSPNGEWIGGRGPGDPNVDTEANTVYVVAVQPHCCSREPQECLVVPGRAGDVAGFTPDSRDVVVRSVYKLGRIYLRKYPISSLRASCPRGRRGILGNSQSQWAVSLGS